MMQRFRIYLLEKIYAYHPRTTKSNCHASLVPFVYKNISMDRFRSRRTLKRQICAHYPVDLRAVNRSYKFWTSAAAVAGMVISDIKPIIAVATAATASFQSHRSSSTPAKTRKTDNCSMMGNSDVIINIFCLKPLSSTTSCGNKMQRRYLRHQRRESVPQIIVKRHKSTLVNMYAVIRILRGFGGSNMCWTVLWPIRASNCGDVSASSRAAGDASTARSHLKLNICAVTSAENNPA